MDMSRVLFLFLLVSAVPASCAPPLKLRTDLVEISANADLVEQYLTRIDTDNDPLSMAYAGYLHAVKAKQAFFPHGKWKFFQRSRCLLDAAVRLQPASAEIRSLRLIVQDRAPHWLGYHGERENDLQFVLAELEQPASGVPLAATLAARLNTLTSATPAQRERIAEILKRYLHGTAAASG
jgi:hypothetical protein